MHVFVVPAAGGEPRGVTQASNRMSGFAWLPDGSAIVVSSSRGSTLYCLPSFNLWTVSLQGGRWRQNTFGEVSYLYPDVDRAGNLVSTRAPVAIRYLAVSGGFRWSGERSSRRAGDATNGTGADTDGGSRRQRGRLCV